MHIPRCRRHRRRRCHCHGDVLLLYHHVSFFVITAAITAAFATVAVVAVIAAKVPQLSSPQSSTLGDCHPSAIVDGIIVIVVIVVVVVVHPPRATDAIVNVSGGLLARPSTTSTPRHLRTSNRQQSTKSDSGRRG